MAKKGKETELEDKKDAEIEKSDNSQKAKSNVWTLRNLLSFIEKGTEVSSVSTDFYKMTMDGVHNQVPVRSEVITSQPLPQQQIIHFGLEWGYDGTITTPIDPMMGVARVAATHAALTYDPSTEWQGEDFYLSHGGRMYHALMNNIRANNTISSANMLKLVKALVAYDEIARAIMLFNAYYHCRLDGQMNRIVSMILSSSGGSNMFSSRDDLLSQIIANVSENFFPFKFFDFWKNRSHQCFSLQAPWYKYELFVPTCDQAYISGLARLFDAYISTTQYIHPKTYLQSEGLWNIFLTDLVPLLWAKVPHHQYIGYSPVDYLARIGWTPLSYDHVQIEYILNKFFTHPFTETLGIGRNKLPKHGVTDTTTTMNLYYWDGNTLSATGKVFYLGQDAYIEGPSVAYSPWLDPIRFVGIAQNYDANNDACHYLNGQNIIGNINYVGDTWTELSYGEWLGLFKRLAFGFQDFELAEPDPDININAQIVTDGFGVNWMEHMLYRDHFKFPFKMPDRHWYWNPHQLHKQYAAFLNLKMDDIELYDRQQPIDAGNQSPNETEGGQRRY
jgi:hypothetical protein